MLNKEERQKLSAIEAWIAADDPVFADGLARGRPRCPRRDRLWPFRLLIGVGCLLALGGLVWGLPVMVAAGAVAGYGGAIAERLRAIRRQGGQAGGRLDGLGGLGGPLRGDFPPF